MNVYFNVNGYTGTSDSSIFFQFFSHFQKAKQLCDFLLSSIHNVAFPKWGRKNRIYGWF